jgi:hypothetical protein
VQREPHELATELKELRRKNPNATVQSLADRVGIPRSYASTLLKLARQLDEPVFEEWCKGWDGTEARLHLGVNAIVEHIAELPKPEQMAAYVRLKTSGEFGRGAGGGRKG